MKENRISIIINKPIKDVFEFTINPRNTPLWIYHIKEELVNNYPPKIGTVYKNRGTSNKWDFYTVIEFEEGKTFTLKSSDGNYYVKYTYKKISKNKTEMEYLEWVKKGELENPFTKVTLQKLKEVIESPKP
mgnify:CR=1 FL=1